MSSGHQKCNSFEAAGFILAHRRALAGVVSPLMRHCISRANTLKYLRIPHNSTIWSIAWHCQKWIISHVFHAIWNDILPDAPDKNVEFSGAE